MTFWVSDVDNKYCHHLLLCQNIDFPFFHDFFFEIPAFDARFLDLFFRKKRVLTGKIGILIGSDSGRNGIQNGREPAENRREADHSERSSGRHAHEDLQHQEGLCRSVFEILVFSLRLFYLNEESTIEQKFLEKLI